MSTVTGRRKAARAIENKGGDFVMSSFELPAIAAPLAGSARFHL
jgi:hypothetical protein